MAELRAEVSESIRFLCRGGEFLDKMAGIETLPRSSRCPGPTFLHLLGIVFAMVSPGFGSDATPPFSWVRTAGSMYAYTNGTLSLRSALAVDGAGNTYMTGGF